MALILPGSPAFAHCTDNLTGTPHANWPGTAVTAFGTNVDGSSVSLLTAIAHDVHYLVVGLSGFSLASNNTQTLLDLQIDPAGGSSWTANLVSDLVCGMTPAGSATVGCTLYYHFPLFVLAGASIGCRARNASASAVAGQVILFAFGCPRRPDLWWCGTRVESLGINAASSKGTDVTPGNSGSYGSWTTIGTSTANYGAIQLGVNGSDGTATNNGYYWQIGEGSSKLAGTPTLFRALGTAEAGNHTGFAMPIFCDVSAGTTLQARATASGTAEVVNAAIYGVY